jgi:hypothetical protein
MKKQFRKIINGRSIGDIFPAGINLLPRLILIAVLTLIAVAPLLAHPISWQGQGLVESVAIVTGPEKSRCELPGGTVLTGLQRVEIDLRDPIDAPPATRIVCLVETACSCAALTIGGTPFGHLTVSGQVIGGDLIVQEIVSP